MWALPSSLGDDLTSPERDFGFSFKKFVHLCVVEDPAAFVVGPLLVPDATQKKVAAFRASLSACLARGVVVAIGTFLCFEGYVRWAGPPFQRLWLDTVDG